MGNAVDPIINGAKVKTESRAMQSIPNMPNVPQRQFAGADIFSTIFVYIALFAAAYWFLIRPQKKRQEKLMDFQSKLRPGDDVITSAGLHGKIIEVNDKTFLIEFGENKSIRIPIEKNHIIAQETEE